MLADWLQGTNMYTLYQSYGVDVGTLFLTGFSSAAVFGTFLGLFVDRFGRRNGCIVFCVLEVRAWSMQALSTLECSENPRVRDFMLPVCMWGALRVQVHYIRSVGRGTVKSSEISRRCERESLAELCWGSCTPETRTFPTRKRQHKISVRTVLFVSV